MKLFLDLDGVLADFDRGVHAVTGRRPEELPPKTMWAARSRAPRFFETLAFMHDAEALRRFCEPHHPTILTGLPLGAWAPDQKKRWVARMLGAHVPVITCMSRDKPRWSGPGHALVDDRASAREGWERKGGAFVRHTVAERSIAAAPSPRCAASASPGGGPRRSPTRTSRRADRRHYRRPSRPAREGAELVL